MIAQGKQDHDMIGTRALRKGVAAFTLCLTIAGIPVKAGELTAGELARLDAVIDNAVAEGRVAGVSFAVLRDGHVVFTGSAGLADLERSAPATSDTVYRIASLTKQFTAAGVLLLAEQGKLSIDDRLSVYMPDFQGRKRYRCATFSTTPLVFTTTRNPTLLTASVTPARRCQS